MNEQQINLIREFEEKILEITGDNLEVITGHSIAVSLLDLAEYAPDDAAHLEGNLVANVTFSTPGYDNWAFFFPADFGAQLATSMVGEDPAPFDPDLHTEALEELMAQVLSPYLSELSSIENSQVETSSLTVEQPDAIPEFGAGHILAQMEFTLNEDDSHRMYKVIPASLLAILGEDSVDEVPTTDEASSEEYVEMSEADFQPLQDRSKNGNGANLDMLMSLDMPIIIELGRTKLTIKNILELGQGSIIELDKLSGDPVDVFINDRKFAEGEVVVVDENFGVRITEIVSPVEKIKTLQ